MRGRKNFSHIGWCEFTPAWQNNKKKYKHNPGLRGTIGFENSITYT